MSTTSQSTAAATTTRTHSIVIDKKYQEEKDSVTSVVVKECDETVMKQLQSFANLQSVTFKSINFQSRDLVRLIPTNLKELKFDACYFCGVEEEMAHHIGTFTQLESFSLTYYGVEACVLLEGLKTHRKITSLSISNAAVSHTEREVHQITECINWIVKKNDIQTLSIFNLQFAHLDLEWLANLKSFSFSNCEAVLLEKVFESM